jgi:hypothetical protein
VADGEVRRIDARRDHQCLDLPRAERGPAERGHSIDAIQVFEVG